MEKKKELMAPFNLIVTHLPGYPNKRDAMRQLSWLLDDVEIVDSRPNIILAKVPDPDDAVRRLKRSLPIDSTPILRVIPVHAVTYPKVDSVREVVHRLLREAGPGSFAVRLDGYLYSDGERLHRVDAAKIIADGVERPVNLSSPDILVYVKVVRFRRSYLAAIYVGPPDGILRVVRLREQQ
ncbi:MAG: THUMP domain-containing protein [Desulfurococcales archaeon]|nr:THUMP domain-containing protein [Desulfurococcales archaeon]